MIIDILRGMPVSEVEHAWDCLKRRYIHINCQTPRGYPDLYDEYPDAPYHGSDWETYCAAKETDPDHDCEEPNQCCDIVDPAYDRWFNKLITKKDLAWADRLVDLQRKLTWNFLYDSGWNHEWSISLPNSQETINIFKWLVDHSHVSWALVRSMEFEPDMLYFKNERDYRECSLRAGPEIYTWQDCLYAMEHLGWQRLPDVPAYRHWLREHAQGMVCPCRGSIYLELDTDYMAWKIVWGHQT